MKIKIFFLIISIALIPVTEAGAITARQNAEIVLEDTSPAFVEGNRIWVARRKIETGAYTLTYSDNNGDPGTWNDFATLHDINRMPASVFVHPTGHIFVAESQRSDCKNARIFRIDRIATIPNSTTPVISVARRLDPGATVYPWGWSLDASNNLFVGEYSWGSHIAADTSANPLATDCGLSHHSNAAFILKVANTDGSAAVDNSNINTSHWNWDPTCNPNGDSVCLTSWVASGSVADRHVHILKYMPYFNEFIITGGDSPRTLMRWGGALNTRPNLFPHCCDALNVLIGFTGLAVVDNALYTGDDWTMQSIGNGPRGNSIRRILINGDGTIPVNAAGSMISMSVIKQLPEKCDTPIFDLHENTEKTEIWAINYDEALPERTDNYTKRTGVHRMTRTADGSTFVDFRTFYAAPSTFMNLMFIATNKNKEVPSGGHLFVWGRSLETPTSAGSALLRIDRTVIPTDSQTACE